MLAKKINKWIIPTLAVMSVLILSGFAPYTNDADTVLIDHFDGATSASILAYREDGVVCGPYGGSPKPSATPVSAFGAGPDGLSQALILNPPVGEPAGSGTYLQYPGGQLLSQPNGTIEFWTYLTTYGPGLSLVSQGRFPGACDGWTFGMSVSATGQLQAGAWAAFSMNSGAAAVPLNAWTHVAASWGSAGAKLYINGVLVGSDANTGMPASGYSGVVMVNYAAGAVGTQIDDLRISRVQRTSFPVVLPSAPAYSVNVKNLSYSDNSGRSIFYNFSAGTVSNNAIQLPDALPPPDNTTVVTRASGETGTTYFWGQAIGLPAVNVTLDAAGQKAVVGPAPAAKEGVAVLYASGGTLPAATGTTGWSYMLNLGNFNLDFTTEKAYEFDLGLGRDGGGYTEAAASVVWVKGNYNGTTYPTPTLIIHARVENTGNTYWTSTPIVRTDLDPAATSLRFDLSVSNGNAFFAAAGITKGPVDEGMTNLGGYTLTTEQGSFLRFPDLYPYIYMGEQTASTALQTQVQTMHQQSDGNYYVIFNVQDPLHLADAVSVTQVGGTQNIPIGGISLNWNEADKGWYTPQYYLIGATPVTSPYPSYTFDFTPQSGGAPIPSMTKSVTGYVTEFATNLLPSGNVNVTPLFSWMGSPNASGYGIEVNDGTMWVWNKGDIPSGQTSITYGGQTPLVNGKTYTYNILSNFEQNGALNFSLANGSFTYTGPGATTISFNGWVESVPSWPSIGGMAAVNGATVSAYLPGMPPTLINTATPDISTGAFTLTGIPGSTVFYLMIQPPSGYMPVLSKFMNWAEPIQALLPFALFTQTQYAALTTPGTGVILGRVALQSNPSAFLSGATVVAREWTSPVFPSTQPILGAFYPVTYSGGGAATGADGIYMVKDVPAGKLVQLVVTLANHTFAFNDAVIPVRAGPVSEESFFATPGQQSPFIVYSYHQDMSYFINMFVADPTHAFTGVTVNGPSLAGDVSMEYITARGRWEMPPSASIVLGSSLPTGPRTYNFTAATGGTPVTGSKTVSVYVEGIATNLQPTGSITASPTFSWTGIAGATGYSVMLDDMTAGTGVWFSPGLPGTQTSVLYGGPALTAGHTYQYTVISSINTDGNDNASSARAQFTYTGSGTAVSIFTNEAAFVAATTPTKLVNFEDRDTSAGRIVFAGNEYAGLGMTFSTPNAQALWVYPQMDYWNSKHLSPGEAPYGSGDSNEDSLTLTFSPAVTAIGWTFLDYGGTGGESIRVYAADNSLIYENTDLSSIAGTGVGQGNNPFWGIASPNKPIARVEIIEAAYDGDDVAYDNFRFSPVGQSVTTITVSGSVKDKNDVAVDGVLIEQVGVTPSNSAGSSGGGLYTLSAPSGVPFYLKLSKTNYVPTYSAQMMFTNNATLVDFTLHDQSQYSGWNVTPGSGIIRSRVNDEAGNYIGGAAVKAFSRVHSSYSYYTVCYNDACTGLTNTDPATGRYVIKNVEPGDTVTVTAEKEGWTFNQRVYDIHADGVHSGKITGTALPGGTVSFSGSFKKFTDDTPVVDGIVELVGSATVKTTSIADGSFMLSGIPSGTPFTVRFSKPVSDSGAYVSTYTAVMQATAPASLFSSRGFNLVTQDQLNAWSGGTGHGVIRGRVLDSANVLTGYIGGAVVTYTSSLSNTYRVKYEDGSGNLVDAAGTYANGKFYILDVAEGDTVTVSATQANYNFSQSSRIFLTHDNAIHQGSPSGNIIAGKVAIGGYIKDTATTPVGIKGATVEQVGASPANTTSSLSDGLFNLAIPSGTPVYLKFSKPSASPALATTYTAEMIFGGSNPNLGDYNLFPLTKLTNLVASGGWGIAAGRGIIRSRVKDSLGNNLGGATVSYTSSQGRTYTVCYDDACSGTYSATQTTGSETGRYVIKNVEPGDTVTVTAAKAGYAFNTRIFHAYGDSVHQGNITGGNPVNLSASSQSFNIAGAGIGSVNLTATGGASWSAVSNDSWITITSGTAGTGNGTVNFSVSANLGSVIRTGTITIAGQTFTVTQAGTMAPPYVGTWGAQQLVHFNTPTWPWYAEASRTTFNVDGTGTMVIRKNDHDGEFIEQTKAFTYTMAANPDGSLALTMTMDNETFTDRLVIGDDGQMGIVDGTASATQQRLMALFRIDSAKTYANSDVSGEYYNIGFERNMTGVQDPPNGNGSFMTISGIHNFNGAGTYSYYGKANSVTTGGSNLIWNDTGNTNQPYTVNSDGSFTGGGGAFLGWLTGNGLAFGGGGVFQNGVNNQVGYFFMKKGDRTYATADLSGKWAVVSFGQDSKTTEPLSVGFGAQIGTMTCDSAGQCSFKFRDRRSSDGSTNISTGNVTLSVAPDGSFGASLPGGGAPAYAGAIGNNGNTIMFNASFDPAEIWHREVFIGVRASAIGDLAASTAGTITIGGIVRDWNGGVITTPVDVTLVGDPTKATTTSITDGSFSLPDVPANTSFSLKFSKAGYLNVYTRDIISAVDMNLSETATGSAPFNLPTVSDLTASGVMPSSGKGLIASRVADATYRYSSTVGGAVVTATGNNGLKSYTVTYRNPFGVLGGSSTYGNGRYYVLDVDDGDTVTVSAAKTGWSFTSTSPRVFTTHAASVSQGRITGTAPGYVQMSGSVNNSASVGLGGARLELNGDGGKFTTTAADGSYTFSGLPKDANFYAKVTATGYVPLYAGSINLQGPASGINMTLWTASEMAANFGVTGSNGLLTCKVVNQAMNPLSGATVVLTSKSGASYALFYSGGGLATNETGGFAVPNIQPGDVVKVDVTKEGYTFSPAYLDGFAGAVTGKYIIGAGVPINDTAVRTAFANAFATYNSNDIYGVAGFQSYVSLTFLDDGMTREQFLAELQAMRNENKPLAYEIMSIQFPSSDLAVVKLIWSGVETDTLALRNESGIWRLYGNQQKYRVRAWSGTHHQSVGLNSYWVGLQVEGDAAAIQSVSVTGPTSGNPQATFTLVWDEPDNAWSSHAGTMDIGPRFYNTKPSLPLSYTFTITEKPTVQTPNPTPIVMTVPVNNFVDNAFGTPISPVGGATVMGNPTFTWLGVPFQQGYAYLVELQGANSSWYSDNLPLTTTSYTYNGPALSAGTYTWYIQVRDPEGNFSMVISEPFTIEAAVLKGDIDGNGAVTLADAILAMKVVSGIQIAGIRADYATSRTDVNGDGLVGAHEAIYILQYLGGVRP